MDQLGVGPQGQAAAAVDLGGLPRERAARIGLGGDQRPVVSLGDKQSDAPLGIGLLNPA
ncbi:MAG: hypothetical protein ACYC1D_16185 [Acidimicrobiales bacterium]